MNQIIPLNNFKKSYKVLENQILRTNYYDIMKYIIHIKLKSYKLIFRRMDY